MEYKVEKRTVLRMEETPVYFPEETITNILLYLPTDSIHRSRIVCKAWHHITTDPGFLATHARRRCSPEVILYTYRRDVEPCTDDLTNHASTDIVLDSLPISSNEVSSRRCLIRYQKTYPKTGSCLLISPCNGVLLFKRSEGFHILCNPATREWAELPRLATSTTTGYAFYFHHSSSEYRLLCNDGSFHPMWYILATGAPEPRYLQMRDGMAPIANRITDLLATTPVDLKGRIHWPPQRTSNTIEATEMVVFETLSETFHVIAGPPATTTTQLVKLFCMNDLLFAADFGPKSHIELWVLKDNVDRRWECHHKVAMSEQLIKPNRSRRHIDRCPRPWHGGAAAAGDSEGNVMLGNCSCLFVYNVRTKTERTVKAKARSNVVVSHHEFRENLMPHPHFRASSSADLQLTHFWS